MVYCGIVCYGLAWCACEQEQEQELVEAYAEIAQLETDLRNVASSSVRRLRQRPSLVSRVIDWVTQAQRGVDSVCGKRESGSGTADKQSRRRRGRQAAEVANISYMYFFSVYRYLITT